MAQLLVNGQPPSALGSTSNESGPAPVKYKNSARPPEASSKSAKRYASPARAVNAGSPKPSRMGVSSVKVPTQKLVHGSVTVPSPLPIPPSSSLPPQPASAKTLPTSPSAFQARVDCLIVLTSRPEYHELRVPDREPGADLARAAAGEARGHLPTCGARGYR